MRWVLLLFLALALSLLPRPATACGGLFCTTTPVDQAVERIIFAVHPTTNKITAYVQINYTGGATDFSWVVPVPSNPEVDVATTAPFSDLSDITRTRFIFPASTCPRLQTVNYALEGHTSAGVPIDAEQDGVDIYQRGAVGPYDFAVIGGEHPGLLVAWLRDNGYRITPEMEPLVKVYTDEGMLFLAMKLQSRRGTQDIQPIKMTYKGSQPMIPIRLTAVAANPNMGILVWIFGEAQMKPANMAAVSVDDNQVALMDTSGTNNYNLLRGASIDAVGGHGFITEYAQPTATFASSDPEIKQLVRQHPYLTRLYTEMSPEEMTVDPLFEPDPALPNVSNIHDYTSRPSPYTCAAGGSGVKSISLQQSEARWGLPAETLFCMSMIGLLAAVCIGFWIRDSYGSERDSHDRRRHHDHR